MEVIVKKREVKRKKRGPTEERIGRKIMNEKKLALQEKILNREYWRELQEVLMDEDADSD